MKKGELITAYEEQKKETELWKRRYLAEKERAEAAASDLEIRHLQNKLAYEKNYTDMNKTLASIREEENIRLKEENRMLMEDNERLLEDFKVKYRPGIAERERLLEEMQSKQDEWVKYQIEKLKNENTELKAKLGKQEMTISFLKTLIRDRIYDSSEVGVELEKIYKRVGKPGRANIDDETKNRVRFLKNEGYSMRKIAEMERISVGCVHKILHET